MEIESVELGLARAAGGDVTQVRLVAEATDAGAGPWSLRDTALDEGTDEAGQDRRDFCMILGSADDGKLDVVVCPNVRPIIAHFHPGLGEIYFVLDGWIHIKTYDPTTAQYTEQRPEKNEIAPQLHTGLIPRGQTCTILC